MNLRKVYSDKIKELELQSDSLQIQAIDDLQIILNNLISKKASKVGFFSKSLYKPIKGLYMWGGVGRGKTFIMDIFYNSTPIEKKVRMHFAHFMRDIHSRLRAYQGTKNPVSKVAYDIAKAHHLICFDEFFVEDIADAMILGNVFRELFKLGVVLVATSNIEPEGLYKNGLQRELFMPAIQVLIENVDVLNLDSGIDYRFRLPTDYSHYIYPYNEYDRKKFFDKFFLANKHFDKDLNLNLLGRDLPSMLASHNEICFNFAVICGDERGTYDYIELCKQYKHIYLYDLKYFNDFNEDMARRFISLIDECYDQGVLVTILAEDDFTNIYKGNRLKFEFQRTISRINDMQNSDYGN